MDWAAGVGVPFVFVGFFVANLSDDTLAVVDRAVVPNDPFYSSYTALHLLSGGPGSNRFFDSCFRLAYHHRAKRVIGRAAYAPKRIVGWYA